MTGDPPCFDCKHLDRAALRGPGPERCAAFPGGIPTAILLLRADHREPYPGDHGIRFEPIEPETAPSPERGLIDAIEAGLTEGDDRLIESIDGHPYEILADGRRIPLYD